LLEAPSELTAAQELTALHAIRRPGVENIALGLGFRSRIAAKHHRTMQPMGMASKPEQNLSIASRGTLTEKVGWISRQNPLAFESQKALGFSTVLHEKNSSACDEQP